MVGGLEHPIRAADDAVGAMPANLWLTRTWQTDEGLPDNNVTGLAQSADGYLWVATLGGLIRFDGVSLEEFSTVHIPRVITRNVRKMYLDRRGLFWLGMDRGALIRVSHSAARVFDAQDGIGEGRITDMAEDGEGGFWFVGGNSVYRILGNKVNRFGAESGLPSGGHMGLVTDGRGQLWFSCGPKIGMFRDGRWQILLPLDSDPVCLAAARSGGMWICTETQVLKFAEGGEPQKLARLPEATTVSVMLEDHSGTLWVGTGTHGLLRLQGNSLERVAVSHPEISALMEDREGNLWIGTMGGGLNQLRSRAFELSTTKAGLPFESVRSVCQDTNGWIWAVLKNGSLARSHNGEWNPVTSDEGWSGGSANCVVSDQRGGIWIGCEDRGLEHWSGGKTLAWGRPEGLGSQNVRSLLQAANGDLWIATDSPNQLWRFRNDQLQKLVMPKSVRTIRALTEGVDGNIWAGSSDGQVLRVHGNDVVNEAGAQQGPPYSVRCLHTTADGSLWIGYAGWGIGRWQDGKYARISMAQGLFDDYVSQMLSDRHGNLWLIGNHGLFKVRLEDLAGVAEGRREHLHSIAYGRGEGLPSLQPVCENNPTVWAGADGRLWFATCNGLLSVQPDKIPDNPQPPPVLLKAVKVDDQLLALYDSQFPILTPGSAKLSDLRAPTRSLQLPPGHKKVEFSFTALSYSSPENVQFRHRLKDFDTKWIEDGAQRSATYPRLPAGRYEFEVTACNNAGVWSDAGFHLPFVVGQFFWQTWWFRALLLVVFTAGVAAVVRYVSFRHLRLKMQRLEQQAMLDKERARIAKDLHDDLGASMTQMTLLLELAVQPRSEPGSVVSRVQDGLQTAREAIKALDAAVWAINPANNTLPELVAYIGQFAMGFLQQADIRCDLDLPDHPPERLVSSELRHSLFLIVKEALNNVVRHAHASQVRLRIAITTMNLEVLVEDNGCGFARPPDNSLSDGLRNMRQRAKELNAALTLESTPGAGTRVAVRYPWPPDN